MKNLYVISFSLFFAFLCACEPEESYGEKTFSHPDHHNQGQNGSSAYGTDASGPTKKSLNDIQLELTSLERSLSRNFGYSFVYRAGLFQTIVPPKQIANTPSVSFKFYKDSLEYAAYNLFLEKNKARFLNSNSTSRVHQYRDLLKRTSAMINLIHNPTQAYVLYQLNALEQNQYDFRVTVLIDSINTRVVLYSPHGGHSHASFSAKSRSVFAANLCSMLGALNRFDFNSASKRRCSDYDKVNFIRRVKPHRSLKENTDRVNSKIIEKSLDLVKSTMKDSSIFLDNSVLDKQKRASFESHSFKANSHYSRHEVQVALNNNLYENLYFLIEVLEAKERVLGLSKQEIRNLNTAYTAIANLSYTDDSFSIGLSPFHSDVFTKTNFSAANSAPVNNTSATANNAMKRESVDLSVSSTSSTSSLGHTETITLDTCDVSEVVTDTTVITETQEQVQPQVLTQDQIQVKDVQNDIQTVNQVEIQSETELEIEGDAQTAIETTQENEDAILAEGNSSNAPLNTFKETPITLPEDVEEFFRD